LTFINSTSFDFGTAFANSNPQSIIKPKIKNKIMKKTMFSMLIVAVAMMSAVSASAAEHPAYLHALSDLRAARWMLEHRPGSWKQTEDEVAAVREIDAAIGEIKKAGIDDHKDLNDHPKDEINDHVGRLHKAAEYLGKANRDVDEHEANEAAKGLRERAHQHINEALKNTERAIHNVH
jgi:hypothetical protein